MKRLIVFAALLCAPSAFGSIKSDTATFTGGRIYFSTGADTYLDYDGTTFCLYVNGVQEECWGRPQLLLETAPDALLLEDATNLLLE